MYFCRHSVFDFCTLDRKSLGFVQRFSGIIFLIFIVKKFFTFLLFSAQKDGVVSFRHRCQKRLPSTSSCTSVILTSKRHHDTYLLFREEFKSEEPLMSCPVTGFIITRDERPLCDAEGFTIDFAFIYNESVLFLDFETLVPLSPPW